MRAGQIVARTVMRFGFPIVSHHGNSKSIIVKNSQRMATVSLNMQCNDMRINRFSSSSSSQADQDKKSKKRVDPMARRPNQKCDPYEMGGKPMEWKQAQELLTSTLEAPWNIITNDNDDPKGMKLVRVFHHDSYTNASKFTNILTAIATQHNHYPPNIILQRKLGKREWNITTTVECFTPTLQGLSFHDFHIAMMIDVEITRTHIQSMLLQQQQQQTTTT